MKLAGIFTPLSLVLADTAATEALARALAPRLRGGDVLTLEGELGAGKTTFVRALLRALGFVGAVKSPTYALLESYDFPRYTFHHMDFYRLEHALAWQEAGLEESFVHDAVIAIEWPSRAAGLPTPTLALSFRVNADDSRTLEMQPHDVRGDALIEGLN